MKIHHLAAVLLLAASASFGQRPRGAGGGNSSGPLDLSKTQIIDGSVTSINVTYGAQYPSIVVNQAVIKLGPFWYLQDRDFELRLGDTVSVTAAQSFRARDVYWHAIEVVNKTTSTTIRFRDATGLPLWNPSSSPGFVSNSTPLGCVDPGTIAVVTGTIDKVIAGPGIQTPNVVLNVAGTLLTIRLGPERILLASDFELREGDVLTAKIGLAACTGQLVALQLTNESGVTLILRQDDGTPVWTR
jgi:hypothetical protein